MRPDRPLSDYAIRLICSTIGITSFILNVFVLVSLLKLRLIYARNIFVILTLLQVFYLLQNLHFTIFYIPFMYMPVSGGYCIGMLCEKYWIPFLAHHSLCIFLIVNLCALFALLLFYRHQNLMGALSRFKLGQRSAIVAPLCPDCDWIERHRNYGVQDSEDVIINGCIILFTVVVYAIYGFACSGYIWRVIAKHKREIMSYGSRIKISQTLQSLVQTGLFGLFLAVPILLFMTVQFHHFEDDSVVLLPSIFLFSLNSIAHCSTMIVTTRSIRENAIKLVRHGLLLDPTTSELTQISSTSFYPRRHVNDDRIPQISL